MEFKCSCGGAFEGPPGYTGDLCKCPYCAEVVNRNAAPVFTGSAQTPERTVIPKVLCPECNVENSTNVVICHQCGCYLREHETSSWAESMMLSKEAVITLAIGFAMASAISFGDMPFIRFILHHFITLIHEFGHAFASWSFGYFSIPAFDFTHGGGVTVTNQNMNIYFRCGVFLLLGWGAYAFRRYKLILFGFISIIVILAFAQLMKWDQMAITYMGHGTVAIMGALFLYRGLSNVAVHHVVERVLYFFLGFFSLIEEYLFTRKVIESPFYRELYLGGKGGMANDFDKLHDHLHISLNSAIGYHSAFCIIAPIAAYFIYVLTMRYYSR